MTSYTEWSNKSGDGAASCGFILNGYLPDSSNRAFWNVFNNNTDYWSDKYLNYGEYNSGSLRLSKGTLLLSAVKVTSNYSGRLEKVDFLNNDGELLLSVNSSDFGFNVPADFEISTRDIIIRAYNTSSFNYAQVRKIDFIGFYKP